MHNTEETVSDAIVTSSLGMQDWSNRTRSGTDHRRLDSKDSHECHGNFSLDRLKNSQAQDFGDGTGRDSYVVKDSGGLIPPYESK